MKSLYITVYVHSLHISHHFSYRDTFDSTLFAIDTTLFHNSKSILHSVLSFTPSLSLFIELYNLKLIYGTYTRTVLSEFLRMSLILDNTAGNFADGTYTRTVLSEFLRMSLILDNTAGNFAVWQMSIFEDASRLKYGHHAVHLSTNLGAPIFPPPPNIDNKHVRSWHL